MTTYHFHTTVQCGICAQLLTIFHQLRYRLVARGRAHNDGQTVVERQPERSREAHLNMATNNAPQFISTSSSSAQ
jgi:hypothetical protein